MYWGLLAFLFGANVGAVAMIVLDVPCCPGCHGDCRRRP